MEKLFGLSQFHRSFALRCAFLHRPKGESLREPWLPGMDLALKAPPLCFFDLG